MGPMTFIIRISKPVKDLKGQEGREACPDSQKKKNKKLQRRRLQEEGAVEGVMTCLRQRSVHSPVSWGLVTFSGVPRQSLSS